MRIPAVIAATAITLTTPAAPETPLEQLLSDVTETRTTSLEALKEADGEDEVREILTDWRKDLIDAADDLEELREDAGELTDEEEAEFDDAADALKAERAGVRKLRSELLLNDDTVVLPSALKSLDGILGTTAFDAFERSENGDARIIYGVPGGKEEAAAEASEDAGEKASEKAATPKTTVPTTPKTTTPASESLNLRAERMQETSPSETTTGETTTENTSETTTTNTSSGTETTTTGTSTESSSSSNATTTTSSSSSTESTTSASVLQNRTTSATSSTTRSTTSSSSTSRTTTSTDNERDDDLADTGTPMRGLIGLGALALLAGLAFMLPGAGRARR